jgi:hypothetical protein
MFAKKELRAPSSSGRTYRKELEYLYARRTAVDALIQSLQDYDRFRAPANSGPLKRKLA